MISSRTPEGVPNHCPVCGQRLRIEPSPDTLDAPCPHCGQLLWFRAEQEWPQAKANLPPLRPGLVRDQRTLHTLLQLRVRFEIQDILGHGPFGWVYSAREVSLHRDVAIKIVPRHPLGPPDDVTSVFLRMAAESARLMHPNIAPVVEVQSDHGCCFTVMNRLPGNLNTHRGRFRRDRRAAAALGAKLARALDFAHSRGVLHGNVKPSNVLFRSADEPVLVDFGSYRNWFRSLDKAGVASSYIPPAYLPPEELGGTSGEPAVAGDVWSLGALLYELVEGRRPFQGECFGEIRAGIETREPSPVDASVERPLKNVILKCLQKDSRKRYSSAAALAEALDFAEHAIPPTASSQP